jgi:hypothetical protein
MLTWIFARRRRNEGRMNDIGAQTSPEGRLIDAVLRGAWCEFSDGEANEIQATLLASIAAGRSERVAPTHHGVRVRGARVVGVLDLEAANIDYPFLIENSDFSDQVLLGDARVRVLSFRGSKLRGLEARQLLVESSADFSEGFVNDGAFNIAGSEVRGQISFSNGRFIRPGGVAINANELRTAHGVHFNNGFEAQGGVSLIKASIGGSFRSIGGRFIHPTGFALDLSGATIGGGIFIRGVPPQADGTRGLVGKLVLRSASCEVYSDDRSAWPSPGNLVLDGFRYQRFTDTETSGKARLTWLLLQLSDHLSGTGFRPQPWEQAYSTLKAMGHDREARQLAISRIDTQLRVGSFGWLSGSWERLLGILVGYGHQPWFGVIWSAALIVLFALVYQAADLHALFMPTDADVAREIARGGALPAWYGTFEPFVYSLDTFVPFLDLGLETRWQAASAATTVCSLPFNLPQVSCDVQGCTISMSSHVVLAPASLVRVLAWAQVCLGAIITSLTVLAFSGILRRG